nr:unnamed protein product [Callosobruchus analis]
MDKRFDKLQGVIAAQIDYFGRRLDALDSKLDRLETSVFGRLDKIAEQLTNHKVQNDDAHVNSENNRPNYTVDIKVHSLEVQQELALEKIEMTKHIQKLLIHFHTDEKKHMNKLHDNIISSLLYLDNKTTEHFLISEANHQLLQPLKKELKEDFNDYANKVRSSTLRLQESFDGLESQVRGLERGVKALIGRAVIGGDLNDSIICEDESIQQLMRTKFEKVLANQEEFMKGATRFGENERDARVFKHLIKNHHEQTQRNLVQLNENIASVYGKSTSSIQEIEDVIEDVQENVILNKLQKIEEYTKLCKGWPDDVKPELKGIQNTLSSIMKVIRSENETPKQQDADTVKAVQNVFGTAPSSSNSSATTPAWDTTQINIRGELASNGHDVKNDTRHPSDDDTNTTGGGDPGTSPDGTTVSSIDIKSNKSVGEIAILLKSSTKSSPDTPENAVTSQEGSGTLQNVTIPSTSNNTKTSVLPLKKSTKQPHKKPKQVVGAYRKLLEEPSQHVTTVPDTDDKSKTTLAEKVTSLPNDTKSSNDAPENGEASLNKTLQGNTSQVSTTIPARDNSKTTIFENVTTLQSDTLETTIASSKSDLKGNIETSQNDTTFPPTNNNNKTAVVEKVTVLQHDIQPSNDAPEKTTASLKSDSKGNIETSQNGTTDNNNKTTVVEKLTVLQYDIKPSNDVPENNLTLQSELKQNIGTQNGTRDPIDNNSETAVLEMVTALPNVTKISNDIPENTVTSLQNTLKGNENKNTVVETVISLQNSTKLSDTTESISQNASQVTTVPLMDKKGISTIADVVKPLQNSAEPSSDAPKAVHNSSIAPSHDESGTTLKPSENSSKLLFKDEPANDEPGKSEKQSQDNSKLPLDGKPVEPDIASVTPIPKRAT